MLIAPTLTRASARSFLSSPLIRPHSSTTARALRRSSLPSGVSATRRLSRANSLAPSSASSLAMAAESAGWETNARCAPRVKL